MGQNLVYKLLSPEEIGLEAKKKIGLGGLYSKKR